jgi:hypothetical protein
MTVADASRNLLAGAGAFGIPLLALAFAAFGIATWAGLRVRDVAGGLQDPARVATDVSRALRLLAAAAGAAPLLGLLGTVHALIGLFAELEASGVFDRDTLTDGVGRALVTTELGLAIAVPAVVLHAAIRRALRTRTEAAVGARAHRRRRRYG